MDSIRKNLKKYELAIFFMMTFLFSWTMWGILYVFSKECLKNNAHNIYSLIGFVGTFMPSVMGILVTAFFHGRRGIKELLKKMRIWKVNPFFYIFVLFFIALMYYIPLFFCNIIGEHNELHSCIGNPITIVGMFLGILVLGGPLGEELGWRGFALPRLQNKLNPVFSGVVLGVIWACWHLPLFFIPGSSQYGQSFISFLIVDIGYSILFTWVYNYTQGSLLLSILFHAANNCTAVIIFNNGYTYFQEHSSYFVVQIILGLIVLLFVIFDMIRKPLITIQKDASKFI